MNISGLDPSGQLGGLFLKVQSNDATHSEKQKSGHVGQGTAKDAVALSTFAQEVRDLSDKVAQEPDVRGDRVQAIRGALQQGQQLATPDQVADALTRETFLNGLSHS